jgi:hypothetical protein
LILVLIAVFFRFISKRPTLEEILDHKWLLPNEQLVKKREANVFLTDKLSEFARDFESKKQSKVPQSLFRFFS